MTIIEQKFIIFFVMDNKNIEVELRGLLDEETYKELLKYLETNGKLVVKQSRFIIDYSTFLEGVGERKSDIRLRVTNGHVELIVKKGKFGGHSREEASVFVEGNDVRKALSFMALLGYKKGVAADRGIVRYLIDGIEIAIQDVRIYGKPCKVHSRFFEAEIMADKNGEEGAKNKIRGFLDSRGLQIFEESEWYDYIKILNGEANGVYEYGKDDINNIMVLIAAKE